VLLDIQCRAIFYAEVALRTGMPCKQASQGEGRPEPTDPTKFSGKKSKAVAKKGAGNTQWDILKLSGIPESEIPSFRYDVALHPGRQP